MRIGGVLGPLGGKGMRDFQVQEFTVKIYRVWGGKGWKRWEEGEDSGCVLGLWVRLGV